MMQTSMKDEEAKIVMGYDNFSWRKQLDLAVKGVDRRVPRERFEMAWWIAFFMKHRSNIITVAQ
jgi:hypothetical protein